jgi:hypothetical protein
MARTRIIILPAVVCLILTYGCGAPGENRARIERAKVDFLARQGQTGFDAVSQETGEGPQLGFPTLREFRECTVRRAWIFEQLSVSPEAEFWAVELEFTGTDAESGMKEDGKVILLYRAFRQVGEEARLLGIFPGTTPDEVDMIESGTRAAFEFLRAGD